MEEPLANNEHLDFLLRCLESDNIKEWNAWRVEYPEILIDLREAKLSKEKLEGGYFFGVDLSGADLSGANLMLTVFQSANLQGANLQGAYGSDNDFLNANLIETNFSTAQFWNADFNRAELTRAYLNKGDFRKSTFMYARCIGTDFSYSYLGHVNFYRSILSDAILTGCTLFNTAQDGWDIEGVVCDHIFTDEKGIDRLPPDRVFEKSEFFNRFQSLPSFEIPLRDKSDIVFAANFSDLYNKATENSYELKLKFINVQLGSATFTVLRKEDLKRVEEDVRYIRSQCLELKADKDELREDKKYLRQIIDNWEENMNQPQKLIQNFNGPVTGIQNGENCIQNNTQNNNYYPQPNEIENVIKEIENIEETIVPSNVKTDLLRLLKESLIEEGKLVLRDKAAILSKVAYGYLGKLGLENLPELTSFLIKAGVMIDNLANAVIDSMA